MNVTELSGFVRRQTPQARVLGGRQSSVNVAYTMPKIGVNLVEFQNAVISFDGGRFVKEGDCIYAIDETKLSLDESVVVVEDAGAHKNVEVHAGATLVLGFFSKIYNNIGHFMVDQLPFAYYQNRIWQLGYRNICVMGVSSILLRRRIIELFERYVDCEFNLLFSPYRDLQFERFSFIHGLTRHPTWKHIDVINFYRSRAGQIPSGGGLRVFVSRADANDRFLLEERQLIDELVRRGFLIVEGSKLAVTDAIRIFSNARVVVGVCGASLANMVFCQSGIPIVNILGDNMGGYWYRDLACLAGLEYFEYRGRSIDFDEKRDERVRRESSDFSIDVGDFVLRLDSVVLT